jgi:hypothetical protein
MAISQVEISANNSLYPDGDLAQMLFFVPIRCCPDDFMVFNNGHLDNTGVQCTKGCDRCQVIFNLNVECPTGGFRNITNLDLKTDSDKASVICHEVDGRLAPMTVGKLALQGKVEAKCIARLGIGKSHARWRLGTNVVCMPHDKGIFFRFKSNGLIPIDWLISKIQQRYNQLIKSSKDSTSSGLPESSI